MFTRGVGFLRLHARLVSYLLGSAVITTWTLLRFFTQRTIFDLIGQQVLAHQWLQGNVAGAAIGTTSYIPKIILLYMPVDLLPGSPRLKLIALTVLVNVVTFVLLGLVLEKLLREFGMKAGGALYGSLLWLSVIAGSVFWIQFTNSRNLEVVGGLFLLYLGIRYLRTPTNRRLMGLALFTSLLFFADTLQIFMTAIPLVLYGLVIARKNKAGLLAVGKLAAGLLAGVIGAKVIFWLCSHILSLHFLQAATKTSLSIHFLEQGLVGSAKAFVHLYAGGADAGKLRELGNILFLILAVGTSLYAFVKRLLPRRLVALVACIFVVDEVVYVLSGQAQQTDTERYLIMTAPALVLLFASLQRVWLRFRTVAVCIVCSLLIVNGVSLGRAAVNGAGEHFAQDAHLVSVERYMSQHDSILAYASMDTSLPLAYLTGSDTKAPLPLSCAGNNLTKSNTFYAKTAYQKHEAKPHALVAVILDGTAITNTPSVCEQTAVISQLGQPIGRQATDDGSAVLLYQAGLPTKLHY